MQNYDKSTDCPLCFSDNHDSVSVIDCGGFDGSSLYQSVDIRACRDCLHVFNLVSSKSINGINRYYQEEYVRVNQASTERMGDLTGFENPMTINRYDRLFESLGPYLQKNSAILDIGAATGGFISYLKGLGYANGVGIEPIKAYVETARSLNRPVYAGSAEYMPSIMDHSIDIVVLDQVIEHVFSPRMVFAEIRRIIKQDGVICISAPDGSRYVESNVFPFYWFLMREHVQHFTAQTIEWLASQHGMAMESVRYSNLALMSDTMQMPCVTMVFRPGIGTNKCRQGSWIYKYIDKCIIDMKLVRNIINETKDTTAFWGIGREFFFIYQGLSKEKRNASLLLDSNPYKQQSLSVNGHSINSARMLEKHKDILGSVVITATSHTENIAGQLAGMGFEDKIVKVWPV